MNSAILFVTIPTIISGQLTLKFQDGQTQVVSDTHFQANGQTQISSGLTVGDLTQAIKQELPAGFDYTLFNPVTGDLSTYHDQSTPIADLGLSFSEDPVYIEVSELTVMKLDDGHNVTRYDGVIDFTSQILGPFINRGWRLPRVEPINYMVHQIPSFNKGWEIEFYFQLTVEGSVEPFSPMSISVVTVDDEITFQFMFERNRVAIRRIQHFNFRTAHSSTHESIVWSEYPFRYHGSKPGDWFHFYCEYDYRREGGFHFKSAVGEDFHFHPVKFQLRKPTGRFTPRGDASIPNSPLQLRFTPYPRGAYPIKLSHFRFKTF